MRNIVLHVGCGKRIILFIFQAYDEGSIPFTGAVNAFADGLITGAPFPTDRLDNLKTLKLMESVYRAAGIAV